MKEPMEFCLTQGCSGPEIAMLIDDLRALGLDVPVGSEFTVQVASALKVFQQSQHDLSGKPLKIDGRLGSLTAIALDQARGVYRRQPRFDEDDLPPMSLGGSHVARRAAAIAMAEYMRASGEHGGDNRGPDVERYRASAASQGASWSVQFAIWCYQEAYGVDQSTLGIAIDATSFIETARATGLLLPRLGAGLLPGDIVVWHHSEPSLTPHPRWRGHAGIVLSYQAGNILLIEGDRGPYPSLVRPYRHKSKNLVCGPNDDRFREGISVIRV
jgi:hypothetical protein